MTELKKEVEQIARRCKNKGLDYDACMQFIRENFLWCYAGNNDCPRQVAHIYGINLDAIENQRFVELIDRKLDEFINKGCA